jgi:hypothetical protein
VYWTLIAALSLLTHLTVDPDVWTRDLGASPAPFPLRHIRAALAARVRHSPRLRSAAAPSPLSCAEKGCCASAAAEKSLPLGALEVTGAAFDVVDRRVPQVRVPTAAEKDRAVVVGLSGLEPARA